MSERLSARAFLRLCRVRDWLHFLPLPLATFDPSPPLAAGLFAAARGVASAFTILAFGYLINSIADRHMDLDARKNPLILRGAGEHGWSLAGLLGLSLLLAAVAPWPAQLAGLLCLAILYAYSAGPRLKAVPIVGSLMNVGNFTPLLFVGMRGTTLAPRFWWVVLAFAGLLLQNQFIHEGADQVEDRGGRLRTTWLTLGRRWTAVLAALSGLSAAAAAVHLAPPAAARLFGYAGVALFAATFPLLLARLGDDWRQVARLRLTQRWAAALFGSALFVAWHWGA
ncbi:MAG: UbiA family prenyltransferase [bacterium]